MKVVQEGERLALKKKKENFSNGCREHVKRIGHFGKIHSCCCPEVSYLPVGPLQKH